MPIYEYQCDKCGCIEEALEMHKTENHEGLFCPHCQKGSMKRIMSSHSFIERTKLRIPAHGSRLRKKNRNY